MRLCTMFYYFNCTIVNVVFKNILFKFVKEFPNERYVTKKCMKLVKNCATCIDDYLF